MSSENTHTQLATVAHISEYGSALVAQTLLESEGILSFVADGGNFSSTFFGTGSIPMTHHKIQVSANDLEKAGTILEEGGFGAFLG